MSGIDGYFVSKTGALVVEEVSGYDSSVPSINNTNSIKLPKLDCYDSLLNVFLAFCKTKSEPLYHW